MLAGRLRHRRLAELLTRDLGPAQPEVRRDVVHRRSFEPAGRVVPADAVADRMVTPVEAAAGVVRQVDPADERDAVVHDDELFVVAVHRPLEVVERALHAGSLRQRLAQVATLRAIRVEERQGRSGPAQHPDVDATRQVGEQLAQPRSAPLQPESG